MLADLHLHSDYSLDGTASAEEMIKGAVSKGVSVMCFTDHVDLDYPYDEIWEIDFDRYFDELKGLKEKYSDQIKIYIGVEIGMQQHVADENNRIVKDHDFDFVIGSQHVTHRKDPYYPETFAGRDPKDVYREYFEDTLENIQLFEKFSSLGHMDYALRYGGRKVDESVYTDNKDIIDGILGYLIKNGIALEMNTSGLKKGTENFNPPPLIFKRFRDLGGELITLGSDAHRPGDIASDFDSAFMTLKEIGFDHYYYFENMVPYPASFDKL